MGKVSGTAGFSKCVRRAECCGKEERWAGSPVTLSAVSVPKQSPGSGTGKSENKESRGLPSCISDTLLHQEMITPPSS